MRIVWWMFAALVGAALVANLALVSARVSQNAEEALRSRTGVASTGLRTQMDLLDLRTSPRLAAFSPELIEATRPPADPAQPPTRPDERALRAAAAALHPEPDLLVPTRLLPESSAGTAELGRHLPRKRDSGLERRRGGRPG